MKIPWGGEDLETALNDWEPGQGYGEPYAGDRPPRGVYQFKLSRLEQTKSSNGFNQLIAHWVLKPHKPEHKQYDGYYMRDYIIVKEDGSTAFRVAPFQRAVRVTARQFRNNTEATKTDKTTNNGDPIYEITKIGPVKFPGNLVMCSIKPDKRNPDYEAITYLPPSSASRSTKVEDTGNDDGGETGGDEDGKPDPF